MIHENLIRLEDIAEEYFGLSIVVAKRKAAMAELPVPAFRLNNRGRGQLFVTRESLDAYVQATIAASAKLHRQMSV